MNNLKKMLKLFLREIEWVSVRVIECESECMSEWVSEWNELLNKWMNELSEAERVM